MPLKNHKKRAAYKKAWYAKNQARILAEAKMYREANPEAVAAAKKRCYERNKDDPKYMANRRDYQQKRRLENRDHVKAIEKRSRIKHQARINEYQRSISGTPKRKARNAVQQAVRAGKLPNVKTLQCELCGDKAQHYHHRSYDRDKRYEVQPLCYDCHRGLHVTMPA